MNTLQLTQTIDRAFDDIQATLTIGQPISHRIDHMLSGTRANVAIKIFGDDLHELRSIGERVQEAVSGVTGLVDLSVEQQTDIPTVRVQFDRAALGRYGLQSGIAADALETAMVGREVGQILEQQVAVPLVVRYPEADEPDLDAIRQTPLRSVTGGRVPLRRWPRSWSTAARTSSAARTCSGRSP